VLVKDTLLKLCGNNNTARLDVADLLNSRQFPACMEDDDDIYSTTSESISESTVAEDEQQQYNQDDDDDNDDVEMIHPVKWNDTDHSNSNSASPYGKTWVTL